MKRTGSQREAIARILKKLGIINITKAADGPSPLGHLIGNLFRKRNIVVPKIQLLPLKNIRIQQLVDAGFNCPAFQSWPRGGLKLEELRSFWKKYSRVSLRNYREENILEETPKLPVVYDQDDWNFIADFCRRYNEEYHTLVNEALPLKDSLTAGNIVLLDAERYAVVYFEGYGTPRDVDTDEKSSKLKMYLRRFGVKPPEWVPEGVQKPIGQLQKFLPDFRPIIVESSTYPYPVGMRGEREILWEWRCGSTHELYATIVRLLERVDSGELALNLEARV